jgi:hypothetical protein
MQTTIVMSDNRIDMFHSSGSVETFAGEQGIKQFLKRIQKVAKSIETTRVINEVVGKAEMGNKLRKVKASLKPLKNTKN